MKPKLTFFIVVLMVLSACNKMRELSRDGLINDHNELSMQPIEIGAKYQTPLLQEIPQIGNVVKGTLQNGLTYYIYKTDRDGYENSAYFQLIQKTGSLVEDDDQLGVAHFVEHYAYNWTQNFPNLAAHNFINRHGGEPNASTSFDFTEYHTGKIALKGNVQIIDTCLLILRDIAANCNFDGGFLDRERKIILEEYRMRNESFLREYFGCILKGTRYADRITIGTLESINQMTLQNLKDYYQKWYQPQNQAVLVLGNVNVSEIEGKIAKIFGDIPRGSNDIPVYPFTRTKHTAPDIITLKNDKNENGRFEFFFNMPDQSLLRQRNTVAYYLEYDMRWRFKQFIQNRLERIQSETMLFDNVDVVATGGYRTFYDEPFIIEVDFAPENWQKAVATVAQELEKMRRYGWTKKEVNALFHDLDSTKSLKDSVDFTQGSKLGYYAGNVHLEDSYLENFVYGNYFADGKTAGTFLDYRDGRIDAGMAHDYFRKLTADSNTVAVLTLPGGADSAEVSDVYLSARNSVDENSKYKYAETPGYQRFIKELKVDVKPGKTVSQRKIDLFDATEFTFQNGVRAVVCQKDCIKYFFHIYGIRPGALTNFSDEDSKKIQLLNDVIATPSMTINNKDIHSMYSVSDINDVYSCYSMPTTISPEAWLKYMHYRLTNNEIDTVRLENCKLKYAIDSKTEKPLMSRLNFLFNKSLHGIAYEERCAPLSPQTIENITVDEMRGLCKKYFANFNGSTFIIYSEYSPKYLKPLLEKYLGSLPSLPNPVQHADIKAYRYVNNNDTMFYHYNAEVPRSDVMINYVLKDGFQYSQERHIVSDAFTTILNELLFNNIRQTDGKVYGFYSGFFFEKKVDEAQIVYATTTCLPQNARPLLDHIQSIISQMANGDLITERHIKTYIDNKLKSIETKIDWNNYVNILSHYYIDDCTDRRITSAKLVRSLTVEQVRAFAKELIGKGIRHEIILEGE